MPTPLPDRPIGVGRTAEVFAWGDGLVVKVLRPGFDIAGLSLEARTMRAAVDAGAPAPHVEGIFEVGGRPGLAMESVGSTSVLPEILHQPWRVRHWGRLLAQTHHDILRCRPSGLEPVKDRLAAAIRRADVDEPTRSAALDRLVGLPDGGSLLHGDLHPDNVFLESGTTRVIDWVDATVGNPAADIVRTRWLLSPAAIPSDLPNRQVAVAFTSLLRWSYSSHVLDALGMVSLALPDWRLPVLVARLAEEVAHERTALARAIDRLL